MKSPVCIIILLLALAQINAIAGLECRCMKRFIGLASQQFKGDKEAWLDEEDEALLEALGPNAWARTGDWPGCEASKCNIEPGNEIWKLRLNQLRRTRNLPGEDQLEPACTEVNLTTTQGMKTHEFSCGFNYEQLQRSINDSSRSQDRNCSEERWSYQKMCLVRPFDPAKDAATVKPVDRPSLESLECRCKLRFTGYASKEFITDQAKWADEERKAFSDAYGKHAVAGLNSEDVWKSRAHWPRCERWRCKMEPGSDFWNHRKEQFEKYFGGRVPSNAEPACLRVNVKDAVEQKSQKFIEMEAFVCGFKFRRLEALIDGPGGSRNGVDGNCTAEIPYLEHTRLTACIVRPFDPRTDSAAATHPVIAMVVGIQLLMLIANKLQIVATGPD